MKMSDTNPKLKRNLIAEAVFEVRFDSSESKDYSFLPGLLFAELKDYTIIEDLNVPDFGKDAPPEMSFIPRHRVYTSDKQNLYSIGKGILSVNTLNYSSFENFSKEIMNIVETHQKISEVKNINRIGLRFVNVEKNDSEISDLFTINYSIPSSLKEIETGFSTKSTIEFEENSMELRFTKKDKINEYILDLDFHSNVSSEYNSAVIEKWITEAHSKIYRSFKECLTGEFYKELSNE